VTLLIYTAGQELTEELELFAHQVTGVTI